MLICFYHKTLDAIKQWLETLRTTELVPIPVRLCINKLELPLHYRTHSGITLLRALQVVEC